MIQYCRSEQQGRDATERIPRMTMSATETPSFRHEQLSVQNKLEIRLLELLPGPFDDEVKANIVRVSLRADETRQATYRPRVTEPTAPHEYTKNSPPPSSAESEAKYEALSYTWGTGAASQIIRLNMHYAFKVSHHLELILRYLRYRNETRRLWIDAICIDQKNDTEKQHQIPIMHMIYAQAEQVVVWLGEPSDDSALAFQLIRDLHAPVVPGREEDIGDLRDSRTWPLSLVSRAPLGLHQIEATLALYRLLLRGWWYRAWIVQEITFARSVTVQCGYEAVSWTQLRVALHLTRLNHYVMIETTDIELRGRADNPSLEKNWPAAAINNALALEYDRHRILQGDPYLLRENSSEAANLSWALGINKGRLCGFPHDRVYSVLGIAGGRFRQRLSADYSQTPEEHDRQVVRAFFDITGTLDLILHSQHSVWNPSRSSWTPDWAMSERAATLHVNGQNLTPGLVIPARNVEMPEGAPVLRVDALNLGPIKEVYLECTSGLLDPVAPFYMTTRKPMPGCEGLPGKKSIWWELDKRYNEGKLYEYLEDRLPISSPLWGKHLELFLIVMAERFFPAAQRHIDPGLQPQGVSDKVVPTGAERSTATQRQEFDNMRIWLTMSRTVGITETDR